MTRLAFLLNSTGFHILLVLMLAFYGALAFLPLQFSDPDTLIYTLVGQAFYRDGILPYGLVFDHKPFLTYFLYGPLAFVDVRVNVFALFSVVWLVILAWIVHRVLLGRSKPFLLVLFVLGLATVGNVALTGNTEIVYVPLELLAVGLALGSAGRPGWFVASAAIAVAAVSVNYASGVPLAPTLLYGLFASSRSVSGFLLRAPIYLFACLAILGVALGLMALGGADLHNYFALQGRFLSGYSGDRRLAGSGFLIQCAVSVGVLLLLAAPGISPRQELRASCRAMALLIVFSLLYFVLSTKFYPHYAFMVTAPAAVVLLSIDDSRLSLRAAMGCLLVWAAAIQAGLILAVLRHPQVTADLRMAYAPLREAVGDEPLMSMQSSVVPL